MSSFKPNLKASTPRLLAWITAVAPYKMPLILLLLILVMVVGIWYPSWRTLGELRSSIRTRQGELAAVFSSLQTAQKAEELRRDGLQIVEAKESRLRPDLDGNRLATEWETLCYKTGVILVSLRIDQPQACAGTYERAPFRIAVSGPLQDILRFLETAERETPGLSVDEFEISFTPGNSEEGIPPSYALTIQGFVFAKGSSNGQP